MNVKTTILTALLTLTMSACSYIDESDRLIYVKPADVKRRVLLEDFTGQRCVNCPKASDEIKALQEQYGEDRLKTVLSFGSKPPSPAQDNGITEAVCRTVGNDIAEFTAGAEQSDDITMLCFNYYG